MSFIEKGLEGLTSKVWYGISYESGKFYRFRNAMNVEKFSELLNVWNWERNGLIVMVCYEKIYPGGTDFEKSQEQF